MTTTKETICIETEVEITFHHEDQRAKLIDECVNNRIYINFVGWSIQGEYGAESSGSSLSKRAELESLLARALPHISHTEACFLAGAECTCGLAAIRGEVEAVAMKIVIDENQSSR